MNPKTVGFFTALVCEFAKKGEHKSHTGGTGTGAGTGHATDRDGRVPGREKLCLVPSPPTSRPPLAPSLLYRLSISKARRGTTGRAA